MSDWGPFDLGSKWQSSIVTPKVNTSFPEIDTGGYKRSAAASPFGHKAHLRIITYCAEEVARQGDRPKATAWMVAAWETARAWNTKNTPLNLSRLMTLGILTQPEKNENGFRDVDVWVGRNPCPAPEMLPRLLGIYLESYPDLTPTEAYFDFLAIHPFRDGNGRVGKILLNWKNHSMTFPVMPPNKWDIANP